MSAVAPTGDHVISLVDEISFTFPPAPPLSQINDIPPEQFCNGDNRPADCGANCMCTHMVDIPYNAVVEVVLVDEGVDTAFAMIIILTVFKQAIPALNKQIFFKEILFKKTIFSYFIFFIL